MPGFRKSSYSAVGNCVEVGEWRKATYSGPTGGNCVEVGGYRKSTKSGNVNCVEAGASRGLVGVRDTWQRDDNDRVTLAFSATTWQRFTASLKA